MSTTINTTALDFDTIKENLKSHISSKTEFTDYDFEASGLSNLLDVLAYNTHYNGLIANFALNEAFVSTAQLRSSVVGLVESLGYIPGSITGAQAVVNLSLNLAGVAGRPATLSIPTGSTFTAPVDGVSYTFQTQESLTAADNGSGLYQFETSADDQDIVITEGIAKTKRFIVSPDEQDSVYVIPDESLDLSTIEVKVFVSNSNNAYDVYADVLKATSITATSTVYYIKEAPNGYYELAFGDGTTLGAALTPGNIIEVTYLSSSGESGNDASVFTPQFEVDVDGTGYDVTVSTVTSSAAGSEKETIESMRKNAPFQFSAQNRMVTADDYAAQITKFFQTYITDIRSYGGEDAPEPKYGTVYISTLFNSDLPAATIANVKNQIKDLVQRSAIASFNVEFVDPMTTYLECNTFFQYNASESAVSRSKIEENVNDIVKGYFDDNLGLFEKSFRRSNMLTLIDESSTSILSSRSEVKMQQRITPTLTVSYTDTLSYPQAIAGADDQEYIITSSYFTIDGKVCRIQNELQTEKLQVFNVTDNEVKVDNVGSYNPSTGTVNISGLEVESIVGGVSYIKITATPANQSAITPTLNNVLVLDETASYSTGVITTAVN